MNFFFHFFHPLILIFRSSAVPVGCVRWHLDVYLNPYLLFYERVDGGNVEMGACRGLPVLQLDGFDFESLFEIG